MSNTSSPKPKRTLNNFEFSPPAIKNLNALKRKTGWTKKSVVERALALAATSTKFSNLA